ncbi:hypothetical protein KY285_023192 [Solanum tuberosum]|nr:hypothetical protein KY285_023192 [Solanum tuberosum]
MSALPSTIIDWLFNWSLASPSPTKVWPLCSMLTLEKAGLAKKVTHSSSSVMVARDSNGSHDISVHSSSNRNTNGGKRNQNRNNNGEKHPINNGGRGGSKGGTGGGGKAGGGGQMGGGNSCGGGQ